MLVIEYLQLSLLCSIYRNFSLFSIRNLQQHHKLHTLTAMLHQRWDKVSSKSTSTYHSLNRKKCCFNLILLYLILLKQFLAVWLKQASFVCFEEKVKLFWSLDRCRYCHSRCAKTYCSPLLKKYLRSQHQTWNNCSSWQGAVTGQGASPWKL